MSGTLDINGQLVATPIDTPAGTDGSGAPANPNANGPASNQTFAQATFNNSAQHANSIGAAFINPANASSDPATAVQQHIEETGAVATLSADVLAGTVPPGVIPTLVNSGYPLQFISQDTVQVGTPPNSYDYNAPTPFIIPSPNSLVNSGYSASLGDWMMVAGTAAAVGGIGLVGGPPVAQALEVAGALLGGNSTGAFGRVASDLIQGMNIDAYDQSHGISGSPGF